MIWTRAELKERAKSVLRKSYWKAFLVSILIGIAGGEGGGGGGGFNYNMGSSGRNSNESFNNFFEKIDPVWIFAILGIVFLIILLVTAFRIFVGYPLEVSGRRFFVSSSYGHITLDFLGYGFEKSKYLDIVKAMFMRGLFNFLWFLLFIIPGIIKYYAYSMVPYILADNPKIGYKRALELSMEMTKGHKFNIWVLELSFMGWYLLGLLALFIGVIFVVPYEYQTKAELYLALRQNALHSNMCNYEELNLINPAYEGYQY